MGHIGAASPVCQSAGQSGRVLFTVHPSREGGADPGKDCAVFPESWLCVGLVDGLVGVLGKVPVPESLAL